MISPTRESESTWVSTWPPHLFRTLLKRPISPLLHPEYWIESWAAHPEGGKWWREQQPGSQTNQSGADPTNHMMDSMRKPDRKSLRQLIYGSSPTVPWATPVLSMPHPQIFLPNLIASSLCTFPIAERVRFVKQLVSRPESWPKPVGQGGTTNLCFSTTLGKAKSRLSAHSLVHCRIKRRHTSIP